jgi:hypothetical protein
MFTFVTQGLNAAGADEDDHKVFQKMIPDVAVDGRSVPTDVENASKSDLAGKRFVVEHKTKACNRDCEGGGSPVEDKGNEVKRLYNLRILAVDKALGTPEGVEGPMAQEFKTYNDGDVLVTVVGAFAEMSSDMERIVDFIATALAADHIRLYDESAKQAKGMFKQRIRKSLGHAAHRGWARLLLDRRRDLIIHGPASHRTDDEGAVENEELEHANYHNPDRGGVDT